jgi:histidinol dehydrogenase
MNVIKQPTRGKWKEILARPSLDMEVLTNSIGEILHKVKKRGDDALREYTMKYDKVLLDDIAVSEVEITFAKYEVSDELKKAISVAAENIKQFHTAQKPANILCETTPGVKCWHRSFPIEKVGLYIPGGTAPLFSTVLMLAIPAKIAGCKEIIMCTPPDKNGKIHPAVLYCANLTGINKVYKLGGAQAIAAMAYGTETVPRVYKIFGPGNQYVTAAKLKVSLENTAIDMPAGPSELAVMADDTAIPAYVASDLLSQAEHGKDSQVLLISSSEKLINNVIKEVDKQITTLSRQGIAEEALKNSKFILLKNTDEMIEMMNEYAPEHLIIAMDNYNDIAEKINNAGAVFLGNYTPESAGDYASGTNHTLPTNGTAKAYSGLNLASFMKSISFQEISKYGLFNIGPSVEIMAVAEELTGHGRAVQIRMNDVANNYKK